MEILLLVVIGLVVKNFKSIMDFISEQSQVNGVPPFQKNSGSPQNLSKKPSAEFSYQQDSFEKKSKVFKVKSNDNEISTNNETNSYLQNTSNDQINNFSQNNKKQNSNYNQNSDFDESIIQLDDLKKGVIWQEILEPPRARRPYKII
jgi:hypothetical protein